MKSIRNTVTSTLTGRPLVDISQAVRQGGISLEIFKGSYAEVVANGVASMRDTLQAVEEGRHAAFQLSSAFFIVHAAFLNTFAIWYAKTSKAKYPSQTPSGAIWCCAFCNLTLSLLFA